MKEETQATLRCFPFAQPQQRGACFFPNKLSIPDLRILSS